MEELLEVLRDVKDDVDYETCTTLIDDHILDSFDILQLISSLNDRFDISIPASASIFSANSLISSKLLPLRHPIPAAYLPGHSLRDAMFSYDVSSVTTTSTGS